MPKAYWVCFYRSVSNPEALAAYVSISADAILKAGGRFLARGKVAHTFEAGLDQRTVVIEFESVAKALEAYESPGYQKALKELGNGAERDIRIIEGAS